MKKLLSVLLAAIMILAIVPVAFAATPAITTTVNKTSVSAGDVVTLTAKIPSNSNLCALTYDITYDTSAFEVVADSNKCNGVFEMELSNAGISGKVRYAGTTSKAVSNSSQTFFTVQFKAKKSNGTISVSVYEAYTANGNSETDVTSAVNNASKKTFTFGAAQNPVYIAMRKPSTSTIRYKDGIVLHADPNKALPAGYTIKWTASNGNFKTTESADGTSLTIISNSNGTTDFTATLYNASNVKVNSVTVQMTSKAGFFDKIGGFFRGLFGTTKVYAE